MYRTIGVPQPTRYCASRSPKSFGPPIVLSSQAFRNIRIICFLKRKRKKTAPPFSFPAPQKHFKYLIVVHFDGVSSRQQGIQMTKCRSVIVDSQGSSPDFGPAKAVGRRQTRPVEGIGSCESTSDMNERLCPITVEQRQNEQQVRSYK